jgi:hypothetical protein
VSSADSPRVWLRPTNFKNIFFPTDAFFPDCRSAAGMAFALVVRTCTEKDTVVQIVSNTGEGGVKYWIIQSFRHSLHLFCFTLSKQKILKISCLLLNPLL